MQADGENVAPDQVRRGLKSIDIDGDGRTDYFFSRESLGQGWCGTGGCWVQIWLSRASAPPTKIFDAQVREVKFRHVRDGAIVDTDLHGSICHTFGAHPCPASFRWSKQFERLVETPAPGGDGVIRFLRPTKSIDAAPPEVVVTAFRAAVGACTAAGGAATDPDPPLTVPDIDGDGIRDWVLPEFFCDIPSGKRPLPTSMTLFASSGDPGHPVIAASAERLEIDVASTPATVREVDLRSCPADSLQPRACKRQRLVWNVEKRRLLPRS